MLASSQIRSRWFRNRSAADPIVGGIWYAIIVGIRSDDLAISVRRATIADAPALAELVNRAYAVESFFVDGHRTNVDEVARLTERATFLVLEQRAVASLAAAVCIEPSGYFGMLSVSPDCQGRGLGTRLVSIAEAMGEAMGVDAMTLQIVNLREELGRWYRSLGYREVGTAPYEHRPVKRPCHFVKMRKSLHSIAVAA
ncbi:MAG: GCN5-related N-acetyltransferase [Myxococcales bacterium]|nr:GCN5-related N-acetyltransferase [Myxococcales bacterium]